MDSRQHSRKRLLRSRPPPHDDSWRRPARLPRHRPAQHVSRRRQRFRRRQHVPAFSQALERTGHRTKRLEPLYPRRSPPPQATLRRQLGRSRAARHSRPHLPLPKPRPPSLPPRLVLDLVSCSSGFIPLLLFLVAQAILPAFVAILYSQSTNFCLRLIRVPFMECGSTAAAFPTSAIQRHSAFDTHRTQKPRRRRTKYEST